MKNRANWFLAFAMCLGMSTFAWADFGAVGQSFYDLVIGHDLTVTNDLTIGGDTALEAVGATAGDDSVDLSFNGVTSGGARKIDLYMSAEAGADEYELVIANNGGAEMMSIDESGNAVVAGNLSATGTTADGSTDIFVGNDSGAAKVFSVDTDGNITIGGNYNTSFPIDLGDDAGFQTLFDKDLTAASAAGFEESVMFAIDHENYIVLYAENDGSGNLQSESIKTTKRFQYKQGTDIASGTNIVVPNDGNVFELTGTTKVDLISNLGFQEGADIDLVCNESVTIDNGTATSGTNITIRLAGAGDFSCTADDVITLKLISTTASGQMWLEKSRSIN